MFEYLVATSNSDNWRIKSEEPIKVKIGKTKSLPKSLQYPLKSKAIQCLMPVVKDLIPQGQTIPSTISCSTPILSVQKLKT